jgi:hypothetical protein
MGMEFPKRKLEGRYSWGQIDANGVITLSPRTPWVALLPSAADLDAVAEEQKAKEATSRPR